MKRTTIFADESLLESLRKIASKEHMSVSAAIRTALEEYVDRRQPARALPSFLGLGRSGRKDIAEHSEELLWTSLYKRTKKR
ncbi:MAG: ribbon-helix-helix domain-containing protein [Nitrospira sp.]|nr:ribbon-helix-helix domain-containing protein [Nitrospira sp.]